MPIAFNRPRVPPTSDSKLLRCPKALAVGPSFLFGVATPEGQRSVSTCSLGLAKPQRLSLHPFWASGKRVAVRVAVTRSDQNMFHHFWLPHHVVLSKMEQSREPRPFFVAEHMNIETKCCFKTGVGTVSRCNWLSFTTGGPTATRCAMSRPMHGWRDRLLGFPMVPHSFSTFL